MTSIRLGSSTTNACPGKAPARIVRNSLMRCSVAREMIAVEDLDAIARQQRRQGAAHRRDDRLQPFCAVVPTNAAEMSVSRLSSLL